MKMQDPMFLLYLLTKVLVNPYLLSNTQSLEKAHKDGYQVD